MYPSPARPTLGIFVEQQIKGLREIGLDVEVFHVNRAEGGMAAYFRMLKPLSAAMQKNPPALLHVMYGGIMADRITRWNSGCPCIVTFHGSDLLGENHSGTWRQWLSRYGVRSSWRAARAAQGVVVVSQRLKQALPPGIAASKVRVIPCGIDVERFRPMDKVSCRRRLGWSDDSFNVLFASNNADPVKRPWLAFNTVDRLKGLGVPAELRYMHGIPNTEVPIWMNASDALLLTSAHEGSPMVVKEALACGLPVVSVDVGDVVERCQGFNKCHVGLPSPDDLAAKLQMVLRMGGRLQPRKSLQELSLKNIAVQLERFYHDTIAVYSRTSKSRNSSSIIQGGNVEDKTSRASNNYSVG